MVNDKTELNTMDMIWQSYRKQMYFTAYRVLNHQQDAEDALQDALLGIARNLRHIRTDDPEALRGYVLLAAKNAALNILRKNHRGEEISLSEVTLQGPDSTYEEAISAEGRTRLLSAIAGLDEKYREVLFLCCVHQLSSKEAASILHRRPGTVRQQLRRGKQILKKLQMEEK